MLFAVVPREIPAFVEKKGFRVVAPDFLLREMIGLYGLRTDLLALFEERISGAVTAPPMAGTGEPRPDRDDRPSWSRKSVA